MFVALLYIAHQIKLNGDSNWTNKDKDYHPYSAREQNTADNLSTEKTNLLEMSQMWFAVVEQFVVNKAL